jgi:hypothetical protein
VDRLRVELQPLYAGVGDTVVVPVPPLRWRAVCRGDPPPRLDTTTLDLRLPPVRRGTD